MIKYNVYFKDVCIGRLCINTEGQYKYVADRAAISQVEETEAVFVDAKQDRDWGDPIPFFDSRIENCKRFGKVDKVAYPNSNYYFIKDNAGECDD